ncbi:zinc ribbon domain-containing protein [Umezakia ovalisporum]
MGVSSQTNCSGERLFQCQNCGFECDRDLSAAIN